MHIDVAVRAHGQLGGLIAVEQAGIDPRILAHGQGTAIAFGRDDLAQAAALVGLGEVHLLVARLSAALVGHDPDLQEVHGIGARMVELAVLHAAAGAHHLHVTGADDRARAHRVLVFQRAFEHVGKDFHIAVAMGSETVGRRHAVVVDDQQVRKALLVRIAVVAEREGVARLQPAVVGDASLLGAADIEHGVCPFFLHRWNSH